MQSVTNLPPHVSTSPLSPISKGHWQCTVQQTTPTPKCIKRESLTGCSSYLVPSTGVTPPTQLRHMYRQQQGDRQRQLTCRLLSKARACHTTSSATWTCREANQLWSTDLSRLHTQDKAQ